MDKANFTSLVGFDFTPSSEKALINAAGLDHKHKIKAIYNIEMPRGIGFSLTENTLKELNDKFKLITEKHGINTIDFELIEGRFSDTINNVNNNLNYLLFLGLNDTGDKYNKYVGSNVQKIIASTNKTVVLQNKNASLLKKPTVLIQINIDHSININSLLNFLKIINPSKLKLIYFTNHHNQFQLNKQILQIEEITDEINKKGFSASFEILKNIFDESNRVQLLNDYLKRNNCNLLIIGKRFLNKANGYNVSPMLIETVSKSEVPVVILGE